MELINRADAIKDAESWVAVDEHERRLQKNVIEWLKEFPPAELGTDCISRQAAIDALRKMQTYKMFSGDDMLLIDQAGAQTELMLLPPIQPVNNSENPNSSEAISRQSVIDMLDETKRIARQNIDGAVLMTFERVFDSLVNVTNALPTIQPEPHWIPVTERLPYAEYGESDNVLATCGHRDVEDGSIRWIKTLYFNGGNWCYPTGETYLGKVYAWMPLPEAFRGGVTE